MDAFDGAKLILFIGSRIVVIERDMRPDIPWPGYLDLPGGGREGPETPEDCVLRETQEEIGLALRPGALVWRRDVGQKVHFAAHLPGGSETRIVFGSEGVGWSLMTPEAFIAHPKAIPHFAESISLYLRQRSPTQR